MTGKFEYKKVCKFCGNTFLAQKSTTKYCSDLRQPRQESRKQTGTLAIGERRNQRAKQTNPALTGIFIYFFSRRAAIYFPPYHL
jgi:hypothetical protein